jgi:hypothetical protein
VLHGWVDLGIVLGVVLVVVLVAPHLLPPGAPAGSLHNAVAIVDAERFLGLFHEQLVQRWIVAAPPLAIAANWWYGLMHFVVTGVVLVWLYRRRSDAYPLWRNTLAVSSLIALGVQAVWPATPPRLLAGTANTPPFVDTLSRFSSAWSFHAHGTGGIANQFAAMPSMHCVWALWVACVLVPRLHRPAARAVAAAYPVVTLAAIVITGNHYVLDAVGGYAALGLGYLIARLATRAGRRAPAADDDLAPAA